MIQKNGQTLKSVPLEQGESLLGRAEGCVIRLDDRAVSRQHAVIKSGPSGVQIQRKSQLAPLKVNGAECESATLKEGDEIWIGPYVLKIAKVEMRGRDVRAGEGSAARADRGSEARAADGAEPRVDEGPEARADAGFETSPNADLGSIDFTGDPGVTSDPVNSTGFPGVEAAVDSNPLGTPDPSISLAGSGSDSVPDLMALSGSFSENASAPIEIQATPEALGEARAPLKIDEFTSMVAEDAKTRVLDVSERVRLRLEFSPGAASIEAKEFDQDEVSLGRGNGCDIVLNDKKASRKHVVIRRTGLGVDTVFTIRDLESANGTYVNGARITEHTLTGDDSVRIGDTEFSVQAVLPGYEQQARNFLRVDHDAPIHEESQFLQGMARIGQPASSAAPALSAGSELGAMSASQTGFSGGFSHVAGISGIPGAGDSGKMSLLEKFRAMPPRSRVIWISFVGMLLFTLVSEFEEPPAQKPKPDVSVQGKKESKVPVASPSGSPDASLPSFEQLKPELQKFVESQYHLSMEYFRNRDYDRSLYEVRKIFQYVADYRDSRDLERYSVEGKQRAQAQEEERKRREQEQANQAKVAKLTVEVEGHMARKEFVQARELFAELIAIDPDNAQVAGWKKEIEVAEEAQERERQLKQLERETTDRGRAILQNGNRALVQSQWFRAIELFGSVLELDIKDQKLLEQARRGIAKARSRIASLREPLLDEGLRFEKESAYPQAYRKFADALRVDPGSGAAKAGIERVRGYLRDQAKQLYTEAVLAESYSDFALARARFEQLLRIAPSDDPYYSRAKRKLARYQLTEGGVK
jgi:pSer/pThr/pTyr-binding forkhead associated (FHA) protein/tetratricopeptide (TPR) repeat protein